MDLSIDSFDGKRRLPPILFFNNEAGLGGIGECTGTHPNARSIFKVLTLCGDGALTPQRGPNY